VQWRGDHNHPLGHVGKILADHVAQHGRRRDDALAPAHVPRDRHAAGPADEISAQAVGLPVTVVATVHRTDQGHAGRSRNAGSLPAEKHAVMRVNHVQMQSHCEVEQARPVGDGYAVGLAALQGQRGVAVDVLLCVQIVRGIRGKEEHAMAGIEESLTVNGDGAYDAVDAWSVAVSVAPDPHGPLLWRTCRPGRGAATYLRGAQRLPRAAAVCGFWPACRGATGTRPPRTGRPVREPDPPRRTVVR